MSLEWLTTCHHVTAAVVVFNMNSRVKAAPVRTFMDIMLSPAPDPNP